jgi:hypothetical protein
MSNLKMRSTGDHNFDGVLRNSLYQRQKSLLIIYSELTSSNASIRTKTLRNWLETNMNRFNRVWKSGLELHLMESA